MTVLNFTSLHKKYPLCYLCLFPHSKFTSNIAKKKKRLPTFVDLISTCQNDTIKMYNSIILSPVKISYSLFNFSFIPAVYQIFKDRNPLEIVSILKLMSNSKYVKCCITAILSHIQLKQITLQWINAVPFNFCPPKKPHQI